jgi:hypothetical protein
MWHLVAQTLVSYPQDSNGDAEVHNSDNRPLDLSLARWRDTIDTNLTSAFLGAKY